MTLSEDDCGKKQITSTTLLYPGLEIRLHQRRVLKEGMDVSLSRYDGVLTFPARHPGTSFSKEQIYEEVWHENSESCLSAISNTVSRIRQKIETDKDNPIYIYDKTEGQRRIFGTSTGFTVSPYFEQVDLDALLTSGLILARYLLLPADRRDNIAIGTIVTSIIFYRSGYEPQ